MSERINIPMDAGTLHIILDALDALLRDTPPGPRADYINDLIREYEMIRHDLMDRLAANYIII